MFQCSSHAYRQRRGGFDFAGMPLCVLWIMVGLSAMVSAGRSDAQDNALPPKINPLTPLTAKPYYFLTNAVQFRDLSGPGDFAKCAFQLTGVITLVDTNRNLVVLQDDTGAVALNFSAGKSHLDVGLRVSLEGSNCHPFVVSFPDYPYHPSGRDILPTFESPRNWGNYYLTRVRGYLHPQLTGDYTFWIASDNSSELWLSANDDPYKARKVAFIPRYGWVNPHEWSRLFSQRSETIRLEAGQSYYIEALQEQTTGADHLSVAWQGPGVSRSVIDFRYLTPWIKGLDEIPDPATKGVLREYWTNYSAGNLAVLTAPASFESALSVQNVSVSVQGRGELPKPLAIGPNQRWTMQDNFRWVEMTGQVKFIGMAETTAFLELSDGQGQVQVRASHWTPELTAGVRKFPVRIEGVSEGIYDRNGLVPGLLWASAEDCISLIDQEQTILSPITEVSSSPTVASTNPTMSGFYGTRGIVTFNDRVFDKDYLFVQEDTAVVFVSLKDRPYQNRLEVGQWIDLGGALQPGKYVPVISPMVMTELGWRSMPTPMTQPSQFPVPENCDGRWTEIEGVVQSVNSNGTLSVMGKVGPIDVWLGHTPSNMLTGYIDSKLRARGVLSLTVREAPMLLVPSRNFVDTEEAGPKDPLRIPTSTIGDAFSELTDSLWTHRTKLVGAVTYRDRDSFFLQDDTGGVRIRTPEAADVKVNDQVEVIGFPVMNGPVPTLTEALVRSKNTARAPEPRKLDLAQALSLKQFGTLIHVSAIVLSQKAAGEYQILELQEQQRVFEATLANDHGRLPDIAPGSRVRIVGMCDYETVASPAAGRAGIEKSSAGPLNIRLRGPMDVSLLKGPPWWTWQRTATLVGTLFLVLTAALLWIHLLARRLERQRAGQILFSRQILQNLEGERRRIAGNLHDGLGQNLLVIKNQALLALQKDADEEVLRQRLDEISTVASQAIEEVRQITQGLRPYQLDRLGLTQAIRTTVSRTSANSSILFAIRTEDVDAVFDQESEIHVYRIVQEAVNNVVKHSGATEAVVVIKKRDLSVSLSVRDNGCGFDVGTIRSSPQLEIGYGLSGITERVRMLGGSLTIDSRPGSGANLTVEVPIPVRNHEAGNNSSRRG